MKRGLLVALTLVLVGGGVTAALLLRGNGDAAPAKSGADRGGKSIAAGLVAATKTVGRLTEPYRCARGPLTSDKTKRTLGTPPRYAMSGAVLTHAAPSTARRLVVGVVADARGPTEATIAQLERLATRFTKRGVSVVVSLGGIGHDAAGIEKALRVLATKRPWLLVAIPGDRESVTAHRTAVAALQRAGGLVVDGSRTRLLALGGATIGTFPGVEQRGQLAAGDDGCAHTAEDAARLAKALAARPAPRLWLGYAPPRQRGRAASDLAIGGIHIGEQIIARAIAGAGVSVVVHGLVDEAAVPLRAGTWRAGRPAAFLPTGAIEAAPVTGPRGSVIAGAALVLEVTGKRVSWRPIRF